MFLIYDYLFNSYQWVKVGSTFSSYGEILRVVPQGSILGLILFNLFINDLVFFIQETEVCNFSDDTTVYSYSINYYEATQKLFSDTHIVLKWFKVYSMVANRGKFQVMFLGSQIDNSKITFMIENKNLKCKDEVKLLLALTPQKGQTHSIRWQFADGLIVFDHFLGLVLKGLKFLGSLLLTNSLLTH